MLTDYIRAYVKGECENSTLGRGLYENHLIIVARYGLRLARETGADPEIVELAAYLHDFSVVLHPESLSGHEEKSVEIAENLLRQFHYPAHKLTKVENCIIGHSSPANANDSIEGTCLKNADVMARIAKPDYWLEFYKSSLKCCDAKSRYKERIELNWPLLTGPAREIVGEQYELMKKKLESLAR